MSLSSSRKVPNSGEILIDPPEKPPQPMRYGFLARCADRHHGTRDGKSGIPDIDAAVLTTPTFDVLTQIFTEVAERERLLMIVATASLREAETNLSARAAAAEQSVLEKEKMTEAIGPGPGTEEIRRRAGGETDTDPAVVATRRIREHANRLAQAEVELDKARADLREFHIHLSQTKESIRIRESVGAARTRRVYAHVLRRLAAYKRRLVRKHPDCTQLNSRLNSPRPELPDWVRSCLPDSQEELT